MEALLHRGHGGFIKHAFVPEFEEVILLIVDEIRIEIVEGVLPWFIRPGEGIVGIFDDLAERQANAFRFLDDAGVENELLQRVAHLRGGHEIAALRSGGESDESHEGEPTGAAGGHGAKKTCANSTAQGFRLWRGRFGG